MEVVPQGKRLPSILPPFQRRDVKEWSTLDSLTGILEHARVQTDHWAATTCNSSHHFGKVIDSRARNLADGSKEQRQQTKQLEVYQANIPGGSVQVIRSQSLTTSSWHGQSTTTKLGTGSTWVNPNPNDDNRNDDTAFDNLKLAVNPLDISSQKMKASVVRRGSIGSRRPPSRPRSIAGSRSDKPGQIMEEDEIFDKRNLMAQTSRLCQQYHEEAKTNHSFAKTSYSSKKNLITNGNDSSKGLNDKRQEPLHTKGPVTLSFLLNSKDNKQNFTNNKAKLTHKKSCSSEDLRVSPENLTFKTDTETSVKDDWNRSSKARRSLQFPVQNKLEQDDNKLEIKSLNNVLKVAQEIEANNRRKQIITNSLKNNQWEDVLKNVVHNNDITHNCNNEINGNDEELIVKDNNKLVQKKPTFITVESLKEVRGRLRKLGSPLSDDSRYDEEDDGIVTESKGESPVQFDDAPKSVKSYVFGMESLLRNSNEKPAITGTGSLESRSTNKSSSSSSSRSEEWYNRRKSYGFEQVNNQSTNSGSNLHVKNKVDSSTDSGICRSSETVSNVLIWNKPSVNSDNIKTSHTITIKRVQDKNETNKEESTGDFTQKGRKTVVALGTDIKDVSYNFKSDDYTSKNNQTVDEPKDIKRGKIADAIRSLREKALDANDFESRRLSEPITISIPVQKVNDTIIGENHGLLLKQTNEPVNISLTKKLNEDSNQFSTSYSKLLFGAKNPHKDNNDTSNSKTITEQNSKIHLQISSWNRNTQTKENDFKRHSIAVDEAKYMDNHNKEKFDVPSVKEKIASFKNQFDLKSSFNEKLVLPMTLMDKNKDKTNNDQDCDQNTNEKKPKKVEFCKTEVHFAAEPGRFNIVETDGKPPSNNMFRRRRRTIAETPARSNLPEIRFGDSQYEKELLSCNESSNPENSAKMPFKESSPTFRISPQFIEPTKEDGFEKTEVNTIIPIELEKDYETKTEPIGKLYDVNSTDEEKPRSILKQNISSLKQHNIFVKTIEPTFDGNNHLGLKAVSAESRSSPWKSTVTLKVNKSSSEDDSNEQNIQNTVKTIRPVPIKPKVVVAGFNPSHSISGIDSSSIAADNGLAVRISSAMNLPDQRIASWSVAERIKQVEDPKYSKGFSTKVNFGSGETTIVTPELQPSPVRDVLSKSWVAEPVNTNEATTTNEVKKHLISSSQAIPSRVAGAVSNKMKSVETLVSTRSGNPKITSISLRYTDDNQSSDRASPTKIIQNDTVKTNAFNGDDYSATRNSFVTSSKHKVTEFEKPLDERNSRVNSPCSDNIYEEIPSNNNVITPRISSQVLIKNRRIHSPKSDSAFLEKTSRQQSLYSEINANRNRSMSPVPFPTRPVKTLPDYANAHQIQISQKPTIGLNGSSVWSPYCANKSRKKDIVKKEEVRKKSSDESVLQKDANKPVKKERRLSSSSSGRDGWLNTPKDTYAKQKVNLVQSKRQNNVDIRRDKKVVTTNKLENSAKVSIHHGSESPIYQNREVYCKTEKDPFDSLETESAILEELTKAADQIMLAVNGYTDEESVRASSDEDYKRKHGREKLISKPLTTISENPIKKKNKSSTPLKKDTSKPSSLQSHNLSASSRTRLCKTSSNSSMDGPTEAKSLLTEERSKRRAARLLQRASSRELLLQNTGASSSEDVASGTEATATRSKQRVVRRTVKQHSSRASSTSHQNSTVASSSRTKERVQLTGGSGNLEKEVINHRRRPVDKNKVSKISSVSGSGKPISMPPPVPFQVSQTRCERSSRLVERRPERQRGAGVGQAGLSGGGGGCNRRTRNQHAPLSKKKSSTSGASHKEAVAPVIK